MSEEWRDIKGYEGFYQISNLGRVKSLERKNHQGILKKERILHVYNSCGYRKLSLIKNKIKKKHYVHTLVLEAFVGPRPTGYDCCHYNNDRSDNRLENLRWDTRKNNCADKLIHGSSRRGEESIYAKLKNDDVLRIRELSKNGMGNTEIGKIFGMSRQAVYAINKRISWKHI